MDILNIVKSELRKKLLNLYFIEPEKRYYLRELEKKLEFSVGNIQRELNRLVEMGLFLIEKKGNRTYYYLNKEFTLYNELRNIVLKTENVNGNLIDNLKKIDEVKVTSFQLEKSPLYAFSAFLKFSINFIIKQPVVAIILFILIVVAVSIQHPWVRERIIYIISRDMDYGSGGSYRPTGTQGLANLDNSALHASESPKKYYWIETENCLLIDGMEQFNDKKASNSNYIASLDYMKGRAIFSLEIPDTADYIVWFRVLSRSVNHDSVLMKVNDGNEDIVHTVRSKDWVWDTVRYQGRGDAEVAEFDPMIFKLKKGKNTFKIRGREPLTKIDKILVTNNFSYKPSRFGESQNVFFDWSEKKSITVTYPNDGERLTVGSDATIKWNSYGDIKKVNIEISIDGGKNWKELIYNIANDKEETVTVPDIVSSKCLLRISDISNPGVSGISGKVFSISRPMKLKRAQGKVVIDGKLSEFMDADSVSFSDNSGRGNDDNKAVARTLWDEKYLYIAYDVKDTKLNAHVKNIGNIWEDDTLELHLDLRKERIPVSYNDWKSNMKLYQCIVNVLNVVYWTDNIQGEYADGFKNIPKSFLSAVSLSGTLSNNNDIDEGYRIEVAIPWSEIGGLPSPGDRIGVEFTAGDRDPGLSSGYRQYSYCNLFGYFQPPKWSYMIVEGQKASN